MLLEELSAADPVLLDTLSLRSSDLTVFAPSDAAFAALQESLGVDAFNEVLADQAALTDILLFHVLSGKVLSADVVAGLEAGSGTLQVPGLEGQYIDITQDDMGNILVNGAKLNLDRVDIEASNGVIHVIDSVITPESRTIADIVAASAGAETPEFATLLAAVSAADPAVLETLSDPEAELTVFAPTDAAFAALGEETINSVLADQAALTAILMYHLVPGVVHSSDLQAILMPADMAESTPDPNMEMPAWFVGAIADEPGFMVKTANADANAATITMTDSGWMIDNANIVITNIDAANGVIHVIDAVILPNTGM
jgi:uncharacterized surface protein with fasciclin (FAS1) repeats